GDHTHRYGFKVNDAPSRPVVLPGVPAAPGGKGNRLGTVHDRAPADPQDNLYLPVPCQRCPFQDLLVGGIGHDAGKFHYILSLLHEDVQNLVINPVPLHRALAVGHHDCVIVPQKAGEELLHTSLSEVDLCPVLIYKIIHIHFLLCSWFHCNKKETS